MSSDTYFDVAAAHHLLERTDLFGWPSNDGAWVRLLLTLSDGAVIDPMSEWVSSTNWRVQRSEQIQHMLVIGAMNGWIYCWHQTGEEVYVGLTDSGVAQLAVCLDQVAGRLDMPRSRRQRRRTSLAAWGEEVAGDGVTDV